MEEPNHFLPSAPSQWHKQQQIRQSHQMITVQSAREAFVEDRGSMLIIAALMMQHLHLAILIIIMRRGEAGGGGGRSDQINLPGNIHNTGAILQQFIISLVTQIPGHPLIHRIYLNAR